MNVIMFGQIILDGIVIFVKRFVIFLEMKGMIKSRIKFIHIEEITKTIKDEFAIANGKKKFIRKMNLINQLEGNWKLELWYYKEA